MIDFSCPQCKALFSVGEHLAGRRARCKNCGSAMVVPQPMKTTVMVDEPRGEIFGGIVAAPAFQKIASFALPYLKIPPD